jgi:hypothetical protein
MTFSAAWQSFGCRNGVESYPEFVEQVCQVTNARENEPITCIVLNSLEFLPDSEWIPISEALFPPSVVAAKFFEKHELEQITNAFESALAKSATQTKPIANELVIPMNFRGKITISFDGGEIRIRREGQ